MANPFLMSNYRNIYQSLINAQNPTQVFMMMAQQDARLKPVVDMLANGADPQKLFNSLCQQKGINPDEFIKSLNTTQF